MSRRILGLTAVVALLAGLAMTGGNEAEAGLFSSLKHGGCSCSAKKSCFKVVKHRCKKVLKCKIFKHKRKRRGCCAPKVTCCAPKKCAPVKCAPAPTCCAPAPACAPSCAPATCCQPKATCCAPAPSCCGPGSSAAPAVEDAPPAPAPAPAPAAAPAPAPAPEA